MTYNAIEISNRHAPRMAQLAKSANWLHHAQSDNNHNMRIRRVTWKTFEPALCHHGNPLHLNDPPRTQHIGSPAESDPAVSVVHRSIWATQR